MSNARPMPRGLWRPYRWLLCVAVGLAAASLLFARGDTDPAAPLRQSIARHARQTASDTLRIRKAVAVAAVAETRSRAASAAVRRARIALRAKEGPPSEDALAWLDISALQDTSLAWMTVRADALDTALRISEVRASRADSLLALASRALVARHDGCRIARVIPCPSRRLLIIVAGAALLGAARK